MVRKLYCEPGTEVLGVNLHAFYNNLQASELKPVMEQHGVTEFKPMEWYDLQTLLDSINELIDAPNVSFNFVAIGMRIGEAAPTPPEMNNPTFEDVLFAWDGMYQQLHRGGEVGKIEIEKINNTHFKTTHTICYPDDMQYGVLYGFAKRFLPRGSHFVVEYETSRDKDGAKAAVIHVSW